MWVLIRRSALIFNCGLEEIRGTPLSACCFATSYLRAPWSVLDKLRDLLRKWFEKVYVQLFIKKFFFFDHIFGHFSSTSIYYQDFQNIVLIVSEKIQNTFFDNWTVYIARSALKWLTIDSPESLDKLIKKPDRKKKSCRKTFSKKKFIIENFKSKIIDFFDFWKCVSTRKKSIGFFLKFIYRFGRIDCEPFQGTSGNKNPTIIEKRVLIFFGHILKFRGTKR